MILYSKHARGLAAKAAKTVKPKGGNIKPKGFKVHPIHRKGV